MNTFIAQRHYNYEGFEIIGVFDDLKMAQMKCNEDETVKHENLGDYWRVTCHEIKKINDATEPTERSV